MEIYIMRHGIAEDVSKTGRDRDRVLTEDGQDNSREAGKALRKIGIKLDAIFSSPYPRAWQTAEAVANELDQPDLLKELSELGAESTAAEALQKVAAVVKGYASVMVVGHEPILSQLISLLLSGSSSLSIAMKKGAVCKLTCVRPEPGGCRLDWLMTAKQLSRIA
jgi:phosphohistidine phosphatase